jgi:hypothetical protein
MIKPLSRIKGLNTMPEAVLDKQPKGRKVTATRTPKEPVSQLGSIVPHSSHAQKRSDEYHKNIAAIMGLTRGEKPKSPKATHTGGRQSSARITDQLNPDRSVSLANKTGRSFPGL